MSIPRVSILMPVYNGGLFLEKSIISILEQSFSDFELIIINDGSTDATDTIVNKFLYDDRIKYLHLETNVGIVDALNIGLKECLGNFIARMDSDDISYTNRLEEQISFLNSNPNVSLCGSWVDVVDENDLFLTTWKSVGDHHLLKIGLFFKNMIFHPTVMFRRKIYDDGMYFYSPSYKAAEDYELWMRLAWEGVTFGNVQKSLIKYRFHNFQTGQVESNLQFENSLRIQYDAFTALKLFSESDLQLFLKIKKLKVLNSNELEFYHSFLLKLLSSRMNFKNEDQDSVSLNSFLSDDFYSRLFNSSANNLKVVNYFLDSPLNKRKWIRSIRLLARLLQRFYCVKSGKS